MSEWFWMALVAGMGFGTGAVILGAVGRVILKLIFHHKVCPRCEGVGLVENNEHS